MIGENLKNKEYNYIINGNLAYITLYDKKNDKEKVTIIDLFNLERFIKHPYSWYLVWDKNISNYYVKSTIYMGLSKGKPKYKIVYLHKFLANIPEEKYGDHINHDSLDNREENIRESDNSNNNKNRKSRNSNNTSGYRNVIKSGGKWKVQLQIDGKNTVFKETFLKADLAGEFAKNMREKYYGEYAGKN